MIRKHKAQSAFIQRLDHIKAVIQQMWVLDLANAKQAGKEEALV